MVAHRVFDYSIYHAALALLAVKGYSAKSHTATLCALVHLWYNSGLSKDDLLLIATSFLEKEEVSYFVEAKVKREAASYGVSEDFTEIEASELQKNMIKFVNKVRKIMENN